MRHTRCEVAKYPTVRSEIRVFSHAANQLEFNEGNLYQGRIPDRLLVGLLHTLSYHGDVAYPPFSFQKFGLSQIEQLVRGEVYPASALELSHNNTHKDLEGYFRFLMASEAWRKGQASLVEPEMWGGNYPRQRRGVSVCCHGRDDRVAQKGTAGDRAVVQGRIDQQYLIESGRALGGQKETPVSRSQSGGRPSRATDPTAVSRATRGHQTSETTSRGGRARRNPGRGRRGREFGEHGFGKMDETDGAIWTQTRTQDATLSTPTHTTTGTPTGHGTPGPQTSGRHRPSQEDHHHPEAGTFCQEKEKEFHARHVGRGSAGRL